MNFTKVLTMMLAGVLAVSPMQFTNGEIVQPAENVTEETAAAEKASTGSVITGDSAIGGFSLIINKYYEFFIVVFIIAIINTVIQCFHKFR